MICIPEIDNKKDENIHKREALQIRQILINLE